MAVNTRFCTGIHTLVLLAAEPDVQQTSDEIARKLNTNPVVIRRVLSLLRQAGLVTQPERPERRLEAGQTGQGDQARRHLPGARTGFDLSWREPYRRACGQGERGARKRSTAMPRKRWKRNLTQPRSTSWPRNPRRRRNSPSPPPRRLRGVPEVSERSNASAAAALSLHRKVYRVVTNP